MKKVFLMFILILVLLTYAALEFLRYEDAPSGSGNEKKIIEIAPGRGFGAIIESLRQAGLIQNSLKFKILARLRGYDKKIRAGEYQLSPSMSPKDMLELMISGRVYLHKLTIPEGYTMREIAAEIANAGFAVEAEIINAATDEAFIRQQGLDAPGLEGYLFPDTYYFPKGVKAQTILSAMLRRYHAVFRSEWKQKAKEMGFSAHQTLTLASIIEKETGLASERPIVSSVFHNRLKRVMRLESDPTVGYGVENFNGHITRKDLERVTPYNTYKIQGLPPGPIANPGAKAIQAALYPADTAFLFFVAKGDGSHYFSTTYPEHQQAVRKYQIGK
ncbi:MAG: hypothetical protein BWK80_56485 [Desulfobacteraceae bacterium IS3]|nr:MAG: hypothetical protein BWK80_56485 [Desulfobacteraceae bacterium IS3]